MPDKAHHFGFEKCGACASTSDCPRLGPLSTVSHPQVCCLFKVARQEQFSDPFLNEGSCKRYDGLCEDCPHVSPVSGQPPTSEAALLEGYEAAPEVKDSSSRKRKPIEPRKREGYKKYTLEWRPPKFLRKIWFGTYASDEISRASDAVNYYLRRGVPYLLPDSRHIFAERPLTGIELQDLLPSCDQVVDDALVRSNLMGITAQDFLPPCHQAAKTVPAYVVYGRQVKNVIHSVLGKRKKSAEKKKKGNIQASQKPDIHDVIVPQPLSPEGEEEVFAVVRSILQTPNYQWGAELFPLDEMFSFPTLLNYGESSTMEDGDISAALWEPSSYV